MPESTIDIDEIVRRVIARLRAESGDGTTPPVAASRRSSPTTPRDDRSEKRHATCLLDRQVVSLAEVEGVSSETRVIEVSPRAVITPAARDLLRLRKMQIRRRHGKPATHESQGEAIVAAALSASDIDPLLEDLARHGCVVRRLPDDGRLEALRRVVDEVLRGKTMGLVLSDLPELAVCAANRTRGIRAVLGISRSVVRRAKRELAANLLIVDPQRQNILELRRMVLEFVRVPACGCPAKYRGLLD